MGPAREVNEALNVAEKIHGIVSGGKIVNQEIKIHCPRNRGEYSVYLELPKGIKRTFSRRIKFRIPELKSLEVHSMPTFSNQKQAIRRLEDGFDIHTKHLAETDTFLLDFEFDLPNKSFLEALVSREYDKEPREEGKHEEYWMTAQLKHLTTLESEFGRIDLREMDFLVDVAVHQDIKNAVPKLFVEELEIIRDLIRETERQKKKRLAMRHLRTRGGRATGDEAELLNDIQKLFLPSSFKEFVEVKDAFEYAGAHRGADFYDDVPFKTFPRSMTVVSRTNLSLDSPAANGKLQYRKWDFRDELEDIFPKAMARLDES